MSGNVNRPRSRKQLSKADLKAYEARRAAERSRGSKTTSTVVVQPDVERSPVEHSYVLSRNDEYSTIRSDLTRLLIIVAALLIVLAILTIFLR